jgi:hypothetical protein
MWCSMGQDRRPLRCSVVTYRSEREPTKLLNLALAEVVLVARDFAFTLEVCAVPLPAALPRFGTGLGALGLLGWRRKRKNAKHTAA